MKTKYAIAVMLFVATSSGAFAGEETFINGERGRWFGESESEKRELEPNKEKKDERNIDLLKEYTRDQVMRMPVKDFVALREKIFDEAITTQSKQDVKEHMMMVQLAAHRSRIYSNIVKAVMLEEESLSYEKTNPYNYVAREEYNIEKTEEINSVLAKNRSEYAVIMLAQDGCGACERQRNILRLLNDEHGIQSRQIEIKKAISLVRKFSVKNTPTLVLISKQTGNEVVIGRGFVTLSLLVGRIYNAIRIDQGEIDIRNTSVPGHMMDTSIDPLKGGW